MTTFYTGNPVPSTDAKDLSDNAENFDGATNNNSDTWVDRLGVTKDTLNGRLKKLGYIPPEPYGAGISFTTNDNTKTVDEGGNIYAPKPSELPFTSSGTWVGDDDARFYVVQGITNTDIAQLGAVYSFDTLANALGSNETAKIFDGSTIYIKENDGFYDVKTGLSANGLDIWQSTAITSLYLELRKYGIINANRFGDTLTDAKNIIERMNDVGDSLYLPSGEYDTASLDVITLGKKVVIHGDTPAYDPVTNTKTGTWINGVLSSAGAKSMAMFDIGIDTRLTATNEGVVFSDGTQYLDSVFIDRVIVIAKQSANHCLLVENTKRVDVGTVMVYGGVQGLAIKSEVFNIGSVFAFDQTTWGCTVRYSPGAPASNGNIGFVYCGTVNNAKSGGVICMNDQQGAALENITFGKVIVDNGNAGFFITNGGNTVSAENITIDDLYISGVADFAIQTFGNPKGLRINSAHLKDCSGSIYNNAGLPEDFVLNDITIENTTAPALLSGSNHKCSGWNKKNGTGGVFIQNESTDLQVFNMDARVGGVINQNGGTEYGSGTQGVTYPANGNLPEMLRLTGVKQQSSSNQVQNDTTTIYTLPTSSSIYVLTLKIVMFSTAGSHSRTVEITQDSINYISSSASAELVFEVQKTGDDIEVKYIFASSGGVDINSIIDAFHEAP